MTVDVDDVNEKLRGLVNLLQIVGIDGVDPEALVEEQQRIASQKKDGSSAETGTTAQSTDSQIMEIIKKLQLAQVDSPEILAALQSPQLRALAGLAAQKQKAPEPKASLEDVMDDEDDNYPKIGPGYSDDISVVSDLSTPTVMTKQNVAEEELYKDVNGGPGALPPMNIGGPARPPMSVGGAGKNRNMLGNVSAASARRAIAKTGGAAAQRRLNYQQQMAKLQSEEAGDKDDGRQSSKLDPSKKGKGKKKKKKEDDSKSKGSKGSKGDNIDWGATEESGWPSFDKFDATFGDSPFETTGATGTAVDADGFFASNVFANFDPFAPVSSSASTGGSRGSGSKKKKKEKRQSKDDGQGTKTRSEKTKDKKGRRTRRASMQM
eukprot:scaffold1869_cov122-Cylindrotheca_fusiformis.AAC.38